MECRALSIKAWRNYGTFSQKKPFFLPDNPKIPIFAEFWKQNIFNICFSKVNRLSLHTDEGSIVYSTATPIAMAQKHVRFCASILQQ
jgi:hypothetical protein